MTNTLNKIMHNGTEYDFPGGISNSTDGTTSTVSNIWVGTDTEYGLITPVEGQVSIVYKDSGGGGWQPGVNTLAYIPLDGDVVDYSSYNRSFTVYGDTASVGTPVFDTLANGKKVASFITSSGNSGANSNWFAFTTDVTDIPSSGNMTVSFWMNWSGTTNYYEGIFDFRNDENLTDNYCWMTGLSNSNKFLFHGVSAYITDFTPTIGTWYNMVCVVDNGNYYIYQNGNTSPIKTGSYTFNSASTKLCIGGYYSDALSTMRKEGFNGKVGDIILENKVRTAQEIQDYYNQTKGNYGIS